MTALYRNYDVRCSMFIDVERDNLMFIVNKMREAVVCEENIRKNTFFKERAASVKLPQATFLL